jgi:nascent polypeptide-associated complex subunit alpha
MFPGMGGRMDPRKMNQMMRQLGIDVKEIPGVQQVIIKTATKDYVFDSPEVTLMTAQGQKTYQLVGTPRIESHDVELTISPEDIAMVVEQAGVTEDEAKAALKASKGDLAEAILKLTGTDE